MKFRVVNPFVLGTKVFKKGDLVTEEVFAPNNSMFKGMADKGFIISDKEVAKEIPVATVYTKETKIDFNPVKPKAPPAVEIKNQEELQKAVEDKPEVKPVVETKIEQPSNKKGRASKA